jgi:hypothetical protein
MNTKRSRRQRQLDDITAARLKRDNTERARMLEHVRQQEAVARVTAALTRQPSKMADERGLKAFSYASNATKAQRAEALSARMEKIMLDFCGVSQLSGKRASAIVLDDLGP